MDVTNTDSCPDPRRGRGGRRAFTLIELLVVVVIVGFLFSILLPAVLRAQHRGKPMAAPPAGQAAPVRRPAATAAWAQAAPPELDAYEATIGLTVGERRAGIDVATQHEARHAARFVLRGPAGGGPVRLVVPFPEGATEAREVSLRMGGPAGLREPEGVAYGPTGISWVGVPPAAETPVAVSFVTRGGDAFAFRLPPATRTRSLDVRVTITGAADYAVPEGSLRPTEAGPGALRWRMRDVVGDRPIQVALPVAATPIGRAMGLFQLAGVAVLLFGLGFWYLGDLRKPGALEGFRWGHFLLLALTYCTFFGTFAVFEFHGHLPTAGSLAVAAATSLPLLLLHVGRVLGRPFAFQATLPLALATYGLVVIGVYGGPWRDYVFLAAGVAAVAFVTATWPAWRAGREAAAAEREAEARREAAARRAPAAAAGDAPADAGAAGAVHCVACGHQAGEAAYCPACGTARAETYGCEQGHARIVLPTHLLAVLGGRELCCPTCGERAAAQFR